MNAGLSNLATLKTHLLADLSASTDYDDRIAALGQLVAGQLEQHCNRRWERTVGATYTVPSDAVVYVLDRLPIETITTVEGRDRQSDSWVDETTALEHYNPWSGVVHLSTYLGDHKSQVRFTYTGGYWWDTSEDDSGSLPSGATALPADLRGAWLMQCEHLWRHADKLGLAIGEPSESTPGLETVQLIPTVRQALTRYVRFNP